MSPPRRPARLAVPESVLRAGPAERARAAADALGDRELVRWCGDLLAGRAAYGDPADPDPGWLAGRTVSGWGSPDRLAGPTAYWSRVWAARTLLYVWDEDATHAVVGSLTDPHWRVREMGLKVCARWDVAPAVESAVPLLADERPRVRAAAVRVLGVVGEHEHLDVVRELQGDEALVSAAADRALRALSQRLDLPAEQVSRRA